MKKEKRERKGSDSVPHLHGIKEDPRQRAVASKLEKKNYRARDQEKVFDEEKQRSAPQKGGGNEFRWT